jgi:hypothetical protein
MAVSVILYSYGSDTSCDIPPLSGGTLTGGPVVASRRQGSHLEHHRYAADALDKKVGGRAHRGGGVMMGRSGSVLTRGRVGGDSG